MTAAKPQPASATDVVDEATVYDATQLLRTDDGRYGFIVATRGIDEIPAIGEEGKRGYVPAVPATEELTLALFDGTVYHFRPEQLTDAVED